MTQTLKIKVTPIEKRTWKSLEEVSQIYSDAEMLEMIHRYQDAQDHAINYRHKAQEKNKQMKALLAAHGLAV